MLDLSAPCPCHRLTPRGQPLAYGDCCGRYIEHFAQTPAPDAEHLMRSRYSAFVLERADYLQATWHSSQRPATLEFEANVRWLGLEVRQHLRTSADQAQVEFVARYRVAGRAVRLHERSRFVCELLVSAFPTLAARQGVGQANGTCQSAFFAG